MYYLTRYIIKKKKDLKWMKIVCKKKQNNCNTINIHKQNKNLRNSRKLSLTKIYDELWVIRRVDFDFFKSWPFSKFFIFSEQRKLFNNAIFLVCFAAIYYWRPIKIIEDLTSCEIIIIKKQLKISFLVR